LIHSSEQAFHAHPRTGRRLVSIDTATGFWREFGEGARGDDPIGFVAHVLGFSRYEATFFLAGNLGLKWPVPEAWP
jgi:hypothetical protein